MGRGNDLERSDGSDGDGEQVTVPEIPGDTGESDVGSGEVKTGGKESLNPKPKTKRVASEKMKAALLRARTAKDEKREKVKQFKASSYTPPTPVFLR
jgi:hypothetical protein